MFDSTLQKLKCPYCNAEFEMEALRSYDEDLKKEGHDDMSWKKESSGEWESGEAEKLTSYVCKSCGGEIVCDDTTASSSCPFCGNPVVMTGRVSGSLRPDVVIPFKLDKKAAKEGLMKHLSGKRLLPNSFRDQNHIDEIKGLYVPFWLFDADVDAHIRYNATKVNTWSDSEYNYTETEFYSVIRAGNIGFERVPVDGSEKMEDAMMESIEPFDYKDAVDFQTAYLAGYFADKYDVAVEESIDRANERIKKSTEDNFSATVKGYATVTPVGSNIVLTDAVYRYALYPVWLLNTTWHDKKYTFVMNGQTGKFIGDLPVDKGKFWKWFGILTAAFSVAVYAIAFLINML